MKQRIAYVWLPQLQTDRITRTDTRLRDAPLAITTETHNGCCLCAINTSAQLAGLTPGMMISAARTICPSLVVRPLERRADEQAFAKLIEVCRTLTPLIATDGLEGLFLDTTGCAHLKGSEREMLNAITSKLTRLGFRAFTSLADTAGAAWALARFSSSHNIAPPGKTRAAIAPLPITGLRLDAETSDTLIRLGLKKIKDLYAIPRASLAARFGIETVKRLEQALGHDPEVLDLTPEPKTYSATTRFLEPISRVCDVETTLDHLLEKLCTKLDKEGLGARKLILTLTRVDNTKANLAIGTIAPNRTPKDLRKLFRDKLETLNAGFGFERASLRAATVQTLSQNQIALSSTGKHTPQKRAALINRLANRLGPNSLHTYAPAESHMPERAFKRRTPTAHTETGTPFPRPNIPRPLRLYQRPLPIHFDSESKTGQKSMTIRGQTHTIWNSKGPERITQEWWHNEPLWSSNTREYWWVTNNTGKRFWIFKQLDQTGQNQWYLHGQNT